MTAHELALALVRTTLVTSAAVCAATLLLSWLKVQSPRTHRIAWALVVLQGWLLSPWTIKIQAPAAPAPPPVLVASAPNAELVHISYAPPATMPLALEAASFAPPWSQRMAPFALTAWLAGAAALVLAAAWRYARIIRTLPLGAVPDKPQWRAEWRRARTACQAHVPVSMRRRSKGGTPKVRRRAWSVAPHHALRGLGRATQRPARIHLRITQNTGPLLAFIPWRYLVLAPRTLWTTLASAEREVVLRHELAHWRRRDLWKSLALRALALPQWFNPLVWLAVRRFDEAAEWACDAAVAGRDAEAPLTLAQSLVRSAEFLTTTPGSVSFQGGVLSRRIHRLVTPRFKEESIMKKLLIPSLLAAIAAVQLIRIERVAAEDDPAFELGAELSETSDDAGPEPAHDPPMTVDEWMSQPRTDGPVRNAATTAAARVPHELKKVTLPTYVIEPADILLIEGVKLVPKSPHRMETFDALLVRVVGSLPDQPIDGEYNVDADGTINLGPTYGRIKVVDFTIEEVEDEIREQLSRVLTDAEVSVSLLASAGAQQITGQHLVAMDGRVNLGAYGSVFVAGMTIEQAREAIETQLTLQLEDPEVFVDVLAYNSKVYYIITQGGEEGDDVVRAPITGNETVLDAIATLGGVPTPDKVRIWIARPSPNGVGCEQILPVAWHKIARGVSTETNYQLLPGDRLFIEPHKHAAAPPAPVDAQESGDLGYYSAATSERPAEAPKRQPVVFISLRIPDGKGVDWPVELPRGASIGQVLDDTTYPLPVDFANALISVSRTFRTIKDGRTVDGETTWFAGWDAAANTVVGPPYDTMQPGDRITIDMSKTPPLGIARNPSSPVAPHPLAAGSLDAAPPTPATRVAELQVHDTVTVLVDPVREEGIRPPSFRIACEIKEIRPNGNLYLEGQAAIRNIDQWWELSLLGEVRREEIRPDRTVSSRSIVNLDIVKRELRAETASVVEDHDGERDEVRGVHDNDLSSPLETLAIQPNPQPRYAPAPAASARIRPRPIKPRQIEYDVAVLVDRDGDLAELTDNGDSLICDTAVLRPALRILAKHDLVSRLSTPRIVSTVGRPAEFTIAAPIPGKDRQFHAAQKVTVLCVRDNAEPDGQSMLVELDAQVTHDNEKSVIDYGFALREGQTALVRLQTVDHKPGPVYIALTPKRVQ